MDEPLLTVVVGTYNRLDQLRRLIESVHRETQVSYVLVVTDAGSDDGTVDYLNSIAGPRLEPVFVGKKLGQARAYNEVFRRVTTPYLAWLSDDNEVVNKGLDVAVRALQSDPRIGMVGLKVRDLRGPHIDASYIGAISSIGILNVNQGVLATSVMTKVCGFREDFQDYGIDPDLTARVLFSGHDVVFTRDIAIHHYRNWSTDEESDEAKELRRKHEHARVLYDEIYGWEARRTTSVVAQAALWRIAKVMIGKTFGASMNSRRRVLGNLPRDYYNALHGRFINPFDPFYSIGREWHLRQRCEQRPN